MEHIQSKKQASYEVTKDKEYVGDRKNVHGDHQAFNITIYRTGQQDIKQRGDNGKTQHVEPLAVHNKDLYAFRVGKGQPFQNHRVKT